MSVSAKPTNERRVDLRRAVSDTDYAAFHFLIDRCTQCCVGSQSADARFRDALARGFKHAAMRKACRSFSSGGVLPKALASAYPSGTSTAPGVPTLPASVTAFADQFVASQDKRHAADYDWSRSFDLEEVAGDIDRTAARIAAFAAEPRTADVKFFLTAVMVWPSLST